jgi:hypothetical protein
MTKTKHSYWHYYVPSAAVAIVALCFNWNPVGYVVEAPASSYYRANIDYQRGNAAQQEQIRKALSDGKLTLHDADQVINPIFVSLLRKGEVIDEPPADDELALQKGKVLAAVKAR